MRSLPAVGSTVLWATAANNRGSRPKRPPRASRTAPGPLLASPAACGRRCPASWCASSAPNRCSECPSWVRDQAVRGGQAHTRLGNPAGERYRHGERSDVGELGLQVIVYVGECHGDPREAGAEDQPGDITHVGLAVGGRVRPFHAHHQLLRSLLLDFHAVGRRPEVVNSLPCSSTRRTPSGAGGRHRLPLPPHVAEEVESLLVDRDLERTGDGRPTRRRCPRSSRANRPCRTALPNSTAYSTWCPGTATSRAGGESLPAGHRNR